jgi:cbb3-type cytochrome oxidase subunit 3
VAPVLIWFAIVITIAGVTFAFWPRRR